MAARQPIKGRRRHELDNLVTGQIPEELRERLEKRKDALQANGIVVRRSDRDRRPGWRLRFRVRQADGYLRQLSMALPDAATAALVRRLVEGWQREYRQEWQRAKQVRQAQRHAEKDKRREHRERRRQVRQLIGGGRKHQRRILHLYDQAVATGLQAEAAFILGGQYKQPSRRPGRPPKGRLLLPPPFGQAGCRDNGQ